MVVGGASVVEVPGNQQLTALSGTRKASYTSLGVSILCCRVRQVKPSGSNLYISPAKEDLWCPKWGVA